MHYNNQFKINFSSQILGVYYINPLEMEGQPSSNELWPAKYFSVFTDFITR